ncbi:MAG: hypothetical protein QOJ50_3510, partial [Cryptosporangiaceae bacterium]|nr:hypothetical protein [Cryptosporangiaceae bacterium]
MLRRRLVRRGGVLAGVLVLVGGGSAGAWAATRPDPSAAYRTATAGRGTVDQRLDLTGS